MSRLNALKVEDSFNFSELVPNVLQIVVGSILLAVASQIAIPLSPVPLTMQTLAVMWLGITLGKAKGSLAVALYLLEGFVGLPVFSGMSSLSLPLMMMRGGYLLGFVIQAYLVGSLFEKYSKASVLHLFVSLYLISLLQLQLGVLWLGQFTGWSVALQMGFYPFVLGAAVKCVAVLGYFNFQSEKKNSCIL